MVVAGKNVECQIIFYTYQPVVEVYKAQPVFIIDNLPVAVNEHVVIYVYFFDADIVGIGIKSVADYGYVQNFGRNAVFFKKIGIAKSVYIKQNLSYSKTGGYI